MPPHASTKLFKPLRLGKLELEHRVILAAMTRVRSPEHIPTEIVAQYYGQRASKGGLLISEATLISVMAGNIPNVPGIFTPEQIRHWKPVTDAVHAKGGYIFSQLWHLGRATHPANLGGRTPFSSSATLLESEKPLTATGPRDPVVPKEMTHEDIKNAIDDFVHAAKSAIQAGFDGVEIHGANGYLIDQFISDGVNHRTDEYGGSSENRARFPLEVTRAICDAIGADRVGLRLSPFGYYNMPIPTSDIVADYGAVMKRVDDLGLAFVHLLEPRYDVYLKEEEKLKRLQTEADISSEKMSVKTFRAVLKKTPLITNGCFGKDDASEPFKDGIDAVAFGRWFVSNPDLPARLKAGWDLTPYDRSTFYTQGPEGYIDYPFHQ